MKIAIVNDNLTAIATLKTILKTVPDYQVIWTAQNGKEAIKLCQKNLPDLILMDIIMPLMDGKQATKEIMQFSPTAILVVTDNTKKQLSEIYQIMGYGALDAVDTPVLNQSNSQEMSQHFLSKVATIRKLINKTPSTSAHSTPSSSLIAIGSSTGGPKALADILSHLKSDFRGAIIIVQHLDSSFSQGLVEWLNQQTPLTVKSAKEGDRPQRGQVLLAATNDHLYLKSDKTLSYTPNPKEYPYRPSVDVFFHSLANHWQNKGIGILLTGMGKDGAQGLKTLRSQGWHTIAQDKDSCTVYGMPKAAVELDAAIQILSPIAIAKQLSIRQ